jgi:drug/metabolite transporter (DMT)-like permease
VSTPKRTLYALVSLMTLLWSVNYAVAKAALRSFPPLLLAPVRTSIAALLLLPIYWWWRRGAPVAHTPWSAREIGRLAALGVFGVAANQLCFALAMTMTSVAHASLIIATTPVQVLALAALRGQERFTPRKAAGMLVAAAGIALLNLSPGKADRGASAAGDLLVFLGALSFSLYTVASKEIAARHGSVTANTFSYAASAAVTLPLIFWQGRGFGWGAVPAAGWAAVLFMAIFPSVVCYLIFGYALSKLPASRVSAFSYTQPLIATLTGYVALGEPVTAAVALGGMLVLSGVWVTGRG